VRIAAIAAFDKEPSVIDKRLINSDESGKSRAFANGLRLVGSRVGVNGGGSRFELR
jgi:hypothetical protein